jgi:predicted kinase
MAGRKGDYSASDLLFAMNLGVGFEVPEVFFGNLKSSVKNKTSKLQKSILEDENIFNGSKFIKEFPKELSHLNQNTTAEILNYLETYQCLVIFIGSPASGKSSYYHNYLEEHLTHDNKKEEPTLRTRLVKYMNMDTFLGTPSKFLKTVETNLKVGNSVIIDNTNGTMKTRNKYLALVSKLQTDIKVIMVNIKTNKQICMHLNALRTKINNTASLQGIATTDMISVPAVAIHTYWKYFEPVDIVIESSLCNCHIDKIFSIEFEPRFLNTKTSKDSKDSKESKDKKNIVPRLTPEIFSLFL